MTLYDLVRKISDIITPDSGAFYDYVLYTSDDNGGFLRTRYCWWETPVKNFNIRMDIRRVLVTSKSPIEEKDLLDKDETKVKMQLTYCDPDASADDAEWDTELGYCYIYIFDLENNTFTTEYRESPY